MSSKEAKDMLLNIHYCWIQLPYKKIVIYTLFDLPFNEFCFVLFLHCGLYSHQNLFAEALPPLLRERVPANAFNKQHKRAKA